MQPVMNRGWQHSFLCAVQGSCVVRMQPVMNRGWQHGLERELEKALAGPNATRDE